MIGGDDLEGTRKRFTGHERDRGTGLDYMLARYYAPALGRFLGVDPVVPGSTLGGKWNRFQYAGDSPISRLDPDGRKDEYANDQRQCSIHESP